jgi:hypothetical protein
LRITFTAQGRFSNLLGVDLLRRSSEKEIMA